MSFENMCMSEKIKNFVNSYFIEWINGIIGENLKYINKYYSDEKNLG